VDAEADLPTTGQVQGDLWVVLTPEPAHGFVWDETTSAWDDAGPVQGPQGVPGPQGTDGAAGPTGPAGPSAVSKDAGNVSIVGTDGLIFTPATNTSGFVKGTGDTMTGQLGFDTAVGTPLRFGSNPTGNYNLTMLANEGGMRWQFNSNPIFDVTKDLVQQRKPLMLVRDAEEAMEATTLKQLDAVQVIAQDGLVLADALSKQCLLLAGGTMTGPIVLAADPANPLQAATKQYVDGKFSGAGYVLPVATGTVLGGVKVGAGLTAAADGTLSAAAAPLTPATATVLGGIKVGSGLAITADGVLSSSVAGTSYLLKAGDQMTGPLRLATMTAPSTYNGTDWYQWHNPTIGLYFHSPTGKNLILRNDGRVTLSAAPVDAMDAATKAYVDSASGGASLPLAGGTMTGGIVLPTTVQSLTWGASTYNIFGASGGVAIRYGNANIVNFTSTGATFIQKITTPGTGPGVEFGSGGGYLSKVGTGIGAYVGGNLRWSFGSTEHTTTLPIVLPGDPTKALQAAPKQYVDAKPTIISAPAGSTPPDAALYPNNTLFVEFTA
jgi:hypothetical protein